MKDLMPTNYVAKAPGAFLVVAAMGVVLEIISGAKYPPVPPVFFILLVPAAINFIVQKKWPHVIVIIVSLFLVWGTFPSKAYIRLIQPNTLGDTIGLWIQTIATTLAMILSVRNLFAKSKGSSKG